MGRKRLENSNTVIIECVTYSHLQNSIALFECQIDSIKVKFRRNVFLKIPLSQGLISSSLYHFNLTNVGLRADRNGWRNFPL